MGSINTEEAARRLARVILADIELYNRERPKEGETLETQIEQGRRLFASRVMPDLVPIFGLVLAERAPGRLSSPAAAEGPSTRAGSPAAPGPYHASPAPNTAIDDRPTPAASIAAQSLLEDERLPARAAARPPAVAQPALIASVPATPLPEAPAVVTQALPTAPPAPEIPVPILTLRVSIPKLLAVVAVLVATGAVLYHFLP
ncbi:MAG TPA: hypothetical protein VGK52_10340 [Polyangia bacterium]